MGLRQLLQPNQVTEYGYEETSFDELEYGSIKHRGYMEIIELKNYILESIGQINSCFNAYRFLKNGKKTDGANKANKKAAELFQTNRTLIGKIKGVMILSGSKYLTGDEIFQGICDRNDTNHLLALDLIHATVEMDYPQFKTYLEQMSKENYSRAVRSF